MNRLILMFLCLVTSSTFAADGEISDMQVIHHDNPNNDYYEVKATGDFHAGQIFEMYINTDNDVNTGYDGGIGAEYLITSGWDVFKYIGPDGGSWNDGYEWNDYWQYLYTSDMASQDNNVIQIDLGSWELAELSNNARFYIDTFDDNWGWLDWNESGVTVEGGGSSNTSVPYEKPEFQDVLDQSRLQWQSSEDGHYEINESLEDVSTDYFYLSDNGHMTFETESSGNKRVELRQKQAWSLWDSAEMIADVQCHYPDAINEYTWMQVFGEDRGKPLLRLLWRRTRAGKSNHLWAFLKTKNGEIKRDLGENPASFFHASVRIDNANLTVTIDGDIKLDEYVGHWNSDNYFKAGVYLSGSANNDVPDGYRKAKVQFASLTFN